MTSQNEPPRIQQEGRQIEVGEEATNRKAKPSKSEIEARRNEKVAVLAKEYGVCRGTVYHWYKVIDEGRDLVFKERRKNQTLTSTLGTSPTISSIAREHGVSRWSIVSWQREGIDITDKLSVEKRKSLMGVANKANRAPQGSITRAAKIAGVSTTTIKQWRNEGVNVLNNNDLMTRKNRGRKLRKNAVPDEIKRMADELSIIEQIGYSLALQKIKNGSRWPRRTDPIKTTIPHHSSPSTWKIWIMQEYRQDLKAFQDWGCLWTRYKENKQRKEQWAAMSIDEKRKTYHAPKDMERRRRSLREADRRRCRESPHYRTINALQSRFRKFFIGGTSKSIRKLIGCTLPEFKKHLESQFKKGMTWQNYGSYWHVDHIIGCANFDHSKPEQVAICWHWTNLQPLEAKDNMRKGKRIDQPQMNLRMEFAA